MTKSESEIKAELEKLSNLRDQVQNTIAEYNRIAKAGNHDSRLAMMSAYVEEFWEWESNDREKPANFDDYVLNLDGYPGLSIYSPDADAWFPSAICIY